MSTDDDTRLLAELSLLEAMYPGQAVFDERAREVRYTAPDASLQLRLPDGYLVDQLPEVLQARKGKSDIREAVRRFMSTSCEVGTEGLDSILLDFNELCSSIDNGTPPQREGEDAAGDDEAKATIVVWLHHLLNTSKRKQALSPPSPRVSGLSKPGYPGVLIYAGPAKAVREHVNELKQLNWQAFQVRLESGDAWSFTHGDGVREVETMKEVVADLPESARETFLESMRMK